MSVVLCSGGLDSAVTLSMALRALEDVHVLRVETGSRQSKKEERAFQDLCLYYDIPSENQHWATVSLPWMDDHPMHLDGEVLGSVKTGWFRKAVSEQDQEETNNFFVPMRNAIFLSIAASLAEFLNKEFIYCGFDYCEQDGRTPSLDKSPDFVEAFNLMSEKALGLSRKTVVKTPLQWMSKSEIIDIGRDQELPFHLTWSCYNDFSMHCGVCSACITRRKGFKKAGVIDPVPYMSPREVKKYIKHRQEVNELL